jgi:hypothetical protein
LRIVKDDGKEERTMGDTKTDLVRDLEAKGPSRLRDALIEKARSGHYHDFDSPLPAPKIQLVTELTEAGFMDLASKVMAGDYDNESPSVQQEEEMRASLGPSVFDAIMGKPPRPEN